MSPAEPSTKGEPRFVVGIGASAGGLEALRPVVRNLPGTSGLAYIVAQHVSPQHRSLMVELLGRETKLEVVEATHDAVILEDTIYIVPPSADIVIADRRIHLQRPTQEIGPKPSVDRFLTSLAESHGEHALGVILSGTGSDGAHGMRAIKAAGGICIAQEPTTAKYDSMPRAAIRASATDLVLPPADIGSRLESLAKSERGSVVAAEGELDDVVRPSLQTVIERIHRKTGTDFRSYKEATLGRQLERRMLALQIPDLDAYVAWIDQHPDEIIELYRSFLISVTAFFRDKQAFEGLRRVLEQIVDNKRTERLIRIWVPGCATGEEVYSIAILLAEILGPDLGGFDIKIFGTDIDESASEVARRGHYPETTLSGVEPELVRRYFLQHGRSFQISKQIRDLVVFARHDLVQDPPFLRLDLISCRNLLIYFTTELQNRVLQIFHYALQSDGFLFLGKSEALGHSSPLFATVDAPHKIFRRRAVAISKKISFSNPSFRHSDLSAHTQRVPQGRHRAELLRDILIEAYAPPTLLIGGQQQLLHVVGDAGRYLHHPEGDVSMDVLDLLRPELRTECRALLHRISTKREATLSHPITVRTTDHVENVRMHMRPLWLEREAEDAIMLTFEVAPLTNPRARPEEDVQDPDARSYLDELEHELASTKEHLQAVIEELETSNEELQSLNEELQASAEELQSSNEELETTNEELQATNEELSTVNEELQVKGQELSESNADLENVQSAISLAVVVVDAELRVRRFTPAAVRIFGLIEHDVGQRLDSVPRHLNVPDLDARINEVIVAGNVDREEVAGPTNRYLMQIAPYRDLHGRYTGAVLTFSDVTPLREAEAAQARSEHRFEMITESLQEVVWLSTPRLENVLYVSPAFARLWGRDRDAMMTSPKPFWDGVHPEDREELQSVLQRDQAEAWSVRYRVVHTDGSMRWVRHRGQLVDDTAGNPAYLVSSAWDITDVVDAEDRVARAERRFRSVFETTSLGLALVDARGKLEDVNQAFADRLGVKAQALLGEGLGDLLSPEEAGGSSLALPVEGATRGAYRTRTGETVWMELSPAHAGGDPAFWLAFLLAAPPGPSAS